MSSKVTVIGINVIFFLLDIITQLSLYFLYFKTNLRYWLDNVTCIIFYYNKNKQNTPAFTNITRYLILIKSVSLIYVVRRVFTTTYSFVLTKSKTFWRFFDLPLHRRVPRLIDSAIRQRNVFHLYEELTSSFKEYTGESTCTVMYTSRSVFTIATKLRNVTSIVFPKKNVFALFFDVVIDRLFGT